MLLTRDSRIELAERLAEAGREVERIRTRLQEARTLQLERADRRGLLERLSEELREAEARHAAAGAALAQARQEALEAQRDARRETEAATYEAARAVVREMVPLVQRISDLNGSLDGLRALLGNPSGIPPSFRPHLMSVQRWHEAARQFVGDA